MVERKRLRKPLIVALSVLVIGMALVTYLANPEMGMALLINVSPARFKYVYFYKLANWGQEIYILGTIHGRHLKTGDYSLQQIRAVVKNLRPDLLLVESRQEELKRDNLGDGPVEMLFANLEARSLGIEVGGMDWWTKKGMKPGRTNKARDDKMVENILQSVPGHKKVLVLTGASHVLEFVPRLKKAGYSSAPFGKGDKDRLFATSSTGLSFPRGMGHYLEKTISIYQEELSREQNPEWKRAYENVIRDRQLILKVVEMSEER
ncbi:MAG: hypothetical protein M1379_17775 [Firmicutes bacterium]|nr:hypothetical protein [Bacillota bacterium]